VTENPVTIVSADPMVRATLELPGCPPARALAAFTDPATLVHWWRGVLSATLTPGASTARAGSTSCPGSANCWLCEGNDGHVRDNGGRKRARRVCRATMTVTASGG